MGASTVSSGWSNHFIEFLQIFHLKMPLWLAYDHWTALVTAENVIARQMAHTSDPSLVVGTQAFLTRVGDIISAQSPELLQRAHDLVAAPTLFGVEIGFNLPAFLIALVITAVLVIGIKESASFNATIVIIKVGVVLFVILLGMRYINPVNWGSDWSSFAPMGFGGIGRGAAYIFFAYIGFDAVSTTAQEAKNPQRDLPIGIIASLVMCTILYILVAAVLTGMVPWKEINIEAPLAVAFLDRGLTKASYLITAGALAGLTSVMLVMLLGQTRVLYSMANDGLLPRKFFAAIHPKFRTPYKNTILVGLIAAIIGSITPISIIGRNGQHRHDLRVHHRMHFHHGSAQDESRSAAAVPHALGTARPDPGYSLQRLHDVQARLGELGPPVHLADHRRGSLFQLQPPSQPRAAKRSQRFVGCGQLPASCNSSRLHVSRTFVAPSSCVHRLP